MDLGADDEEKRGFRFFYSSGKPIYRSSGAATAIRRQLCKGVATADAI
jgi:hypothetical protein